MVSTAAERTVMYTENLSQSLRNTSKFPEKKVGQTHLALCLWKTLISVLPETIQVFSVYERKDPTVPKMLPVFKNEMYFS